VAVLSNCGTISIQLKLASGLNGRKQVWYMNCYQELDCKFMFLHWKAKTNLQNGMTLPDVVMALFVFILVVSGIVYGYVQMNRMATWASWSLAAQSCASEGLEQARGAQWNELGGMDQWETVWGITNLYQANGAPYVFTQTNTLDVPSTGQPISVINNITVTTWSANPPVRMIRSDCIWTYPITGQLCTNTLITLKSPDQ
jgi:Tfp pilus assembly protein PilV